MPPTDTPPTPSKHEMLFYHCPALCNIGPVKHIVCLVWPYTTVYHVYGNTSYSYCDVS